VGFGNFKYVYPRYRDRGEWALSGLNTRVEQAHSEYLQIFSEVGFIGFLAFLGVLVGIARLAFRVLREGDLERRFWLGLGLMMGIGATLVQAFFDFNLQNPASGVTFWVLVGFLEIVERSAMRDRGCPAPPSHTFYLRAKWVRGAVLTGTTLLLILGVYLSLRPLIADYYLRQARFDFEMRDWHGTIGNLMRANRFAPHHFDVAFTLGQTFESIKEYEQAATFYRKAIDLYPYFIEARNNLGAVYIRLGMIDEAIEEFKGAIDINPYHPGLHNNLGYLYSKRNLLKEALQEYQKTLGLDPNNPEVHKNLGLLYYYRLGDLFKAKTYWERYLVLNPEDPQNASLRQKIEEIERRRTPLKRSSVP
jgi:Tfp pilus assembly protein PilF